METTGSSGGATALVTGASRGLGRAIALRLAQSGFAIGVNYVRSESNAVSVVRLIESRGGRAAALRADVACPDEGLDLVARAERELGDLQVLVCNAGITRDRLLIQMSEEDWAATWNTDLAGPRALCGTALERMSRRGHGRIITLSSVVAMTGNAGQSNYATAKAALQGLTRGLAVAGAPHGVTVNCVVPGFFATDATAHLTEEQRRAWFSRIPMGRGGSPHDVAAVVDFLAGPSARYVTGQCIAVDGGYLARSGGGFES